MRDPARVTHRQATDAVLMVRPAEFYPNSETAADNRFQRVLAGLDRQDLLARARAEFDRLAAALADAGVTVCVEDARAGDDTPDALFPNNWFSTHEDGRVVLYPMSTPNRRRERRADLIRALSARHGFAVGDTVDLTALEERGVYVEGTGSLLIDRPRGIVYVCRSARSHPEGVAAAARALSLEPVTFSALDAECAPIYHTNVMLALGTSFALVCLEAVPPGPERERLEASLAASGREILPISRAQMGEFAGNVLELCSRDDRRLVAMSSRAEAAFSAAERAAIARHGRIVAVPIPVIETIGGGGVRCMLAELFLPRR